MSLQAAIYQQLDPAKPVAPDDEALYVDWQARLDLDDVKTRLVNSIALAGPVPVCRLLTGHRGVGKTTELKRVKRRLESGSAPRRLFVSFLEAERWLDLQDVGAPEVVLHIARQLVSDLKAAGIDAGGSRIAQFTKELRDLMGSDVEIKGLSLPLGPLGGIDTVLKEVPQARPQLRRILEGQLPNLYDLVNREIVGPARLELRRPDRGGYDDILVIVDSLDRIPLRILDDRGLSNHEHLFLDYANVLRFLDCDVLYTIPIELAYSSCRPRLTATYGTEILTLPVIPVHKRNGGDRPDALEALCDLVDRRARRAGADSEGLVPRALLERLVRLSGGHVRNLFILLRSALERSSGLPLDDTSAERAVRRQAIDISLGLGQAEWQALQAIHADHRAFDGDQDLFYRLLKDLYAFAYEDDGGAWYGVNPLLREIPGSPLP